MQGEIDLILDLVASVEAGQHLTVANVPPPKNTLQGLTTERAVQVHSKQLQLQVLLPISSTAITLDAKFP